MADNADWSSEEHVRIVCELFAAEVTAGNRSSTHLNNVGYKNVITKFQERTGILYKRQQFKNKWAKLKGEYNCWKTLMKETGLGWDDKKKTVKMTASWWRKAKKDIPGCLRFKEKGLQNEDLLTIMFEDLRNTGDDHFNAASGAVPGSPACLSPAEEADGEDSDEDSDAEEITPPPTATRKRGTIAEKDKGKRPKTSGGLWMQDQITKIVSCSERSTASVESMARKEDHSEFSIRKVMSIVKECGAAPGTKEHFIASELFTKRNEREMFMTLDTPAERFQWLQMKHFVKYGH